jgi:DNA-binding MarR family transcriptional regulator
MRNVYGVVPTPASTTQSLLERAEALQAQAAELAEIITRTENDVCIPFVGSKGAAAMAKGIIRARNERAKFLPTSLFADPAWDILLELYSAHLAQQRMTVGQVCGAAGVPGTTALRWLNALEDRQLLGRHVDPLDARRNFVELTPAGKAAMDNFFHSMEDTALAA